MNILFNHKQTAIEIHEFEINQGGELNIRVSIDSSRTVSIIFKDGKLDRVDHQIEGGFSNTISYWRVMGAISAKIEELLAAKELQRQQKQTS